MQKVLTFLTASKSLEICFVSFWNSEGTCLQWKYTCDFKKLENAVKVYTNFEIFPTAV